MLTRDEKTKIIADLKENFSKSNGVFLTNVIGIEANDAVNVRRSVRLAGGKVVVARNTLYVKAAKGTPYESIFQNLKGPHAIAFSFKDVAAVAKSLKKSSEELEKVDLKSAIVEGRSLSVAEVKALAELPSRDQMLGTLLATFIAPVSALARVLNSIKEQKEKLTA